MSEVLGGLTCVALGVLAIRYHAQVGRGMQRVNEAIYGRLPGPLGRPMLRISPVFHGFMTYLVFAWGLLCVLIGALIAVYALVG